ncbi:MAG: PAS domain S-box protein [Syntrophales bacterium]|jgi:PAS domain S-box-containing protein
MSVKSGTKQKNTGKKSTRRFSWNEPAFRELADNIIDGVYCINTDGYFVFVNRTIVERSGITLEKLYGSHFLDVIQPEHHRLARENFACVMNGKDGIPYELSYKRPDGNLHVIEVHSKPIRDGGKVLGLMGIARNITERKRAEKHIDEVLKFTRSILSASPIGILVYNSSGQCVSANEAAAKILGSTAEELLTQNFRRLDTWKRAGMIDAAENALKTGEVQFLVTSGHTTFGKNIWRDYRFVPFYYEDEVHLLVILSDITELKQAEEALRKSEEKYRLLFDNAIEGRYQVTPEGRFMSANPAAARILGYESPEELIDIIKNLGSQIYAYPEDRDKAIGLMREHGCIKNFEVRCRHKNGSIVWVSFNAKIVQDDQGRILYHEGTSQDITERKQSEDALQEAHRRLDEIIEFLPDATFVIEADGKVIAWNKAIEQMTGVSKAEMIGKGEYEYALPFYGERRPLLIDLALLEDPEFEKSKYDITKRAADTIYAEAYVPETYGGKGAYLSGSASRLRDSAGNLVGAIESIRDSTERKRAEDELAKYRKGLEQLVAERTQGLEDKTKALEELNISLKVLLRHREEDKKELEDRFVMSIKKLIMPFTEKMKRTHLDEQQLAYLSIIDNHLGDITSSLTKRMHQFNFTPREVEIASLLNDGRTTKEIAKIIGIAHSSINSHRNQIRKKLGISRKKVNLRSHLQSFD